VQFEQGQIACREEEKTESLKPIIEEKFSSMIATPFLIETAKSELQESGLPQAETVSKASDILTETTEKIPDVLSNATDIHNQAET
jgi:hypothetical protein